MSPMKRLSFPWTWAVLGFGNLFWWRILFKSHVQIFVLGVEAPLLHALFMFYEQRRSIYLYNSCKRSLYFMVLWWFSSGLICFLTILLSCSDKVIRGPQGPCHAVSQRYLVLLGFLYHFAHLLHLYNLFEKTSQMII